MKLSIYLSAIRPENWMRLYNSIPLATTLPENEYELVIVSPYELPPELKNKNIRLIQDWGCPSRCFQIALLNSVGKYVLIISDDGVFIPGMAVDKAFEIMPQHHKGVVVLKYREGNVKIRHGQTVLSGWETDVFYTMGYHRPLRLPYIPKHYVPLMNHLIPREYIIEIGGLDCRFEQPGIGIIDLSVRLQNDGAEVKIGDIAMHYDHGHKDHGPIKSASDDNDCPLLTKLYSDAAYDGITKIDINNWKSSPEVWNRRFDLNKERIK